MKLLYDEKLMNNVMDIAIKNAIKKIEENSNPEKRISRMQTYLKNKIFECYEAHNLEKAHEYEDLLIELNK